MKYTIKDFRNDFPNDDVCLEFIFKNKFSHLEDFSKYYRVKDRKCFSHSETAEQIHPLANTIFHKSSTPLTLWFFAIFLFSQSKNGVSAKELERQLGVTYKCAYRIGQQIRKLMQQEPTMLSGTVEVDETFIGGKKQRHIKGRGTVGKEIVFGAVERNGKVFAKVIPNTDAYTLINEIREHVSTNAKLFTDNWAGYKNINKSGYDHETVNHSKREYVLGQVHTNTIEGYWSHIKRAIKGTYVHVSKEKLQAYIDEFSFAYSFRSTISHPFPLLLNRV